MYGILSEATHQRNVRDNVSPLENEIMIKEKLREKKYKEDEVIKLQNTASDKCSVISSTYGNTKNEEACPDENSDDDVIVLSPLRLTLSKAERIKQEVKLLQIERYKKSKEHHGASDEKNEGKNCIAVSQKSSSNLDFKTSKDVQVQNLLEDACHTSNLSVSYKTGIPSTSKETLYNLNTTLNTEEIQKLEGTQNVTKYVSSSYFKNTVNVKAASGMKSIERLNSVPLNSRGSNNVVPVMNDVTCATSINEISSLQRTETNVSLQGKKDLDKNTVSQKIDVSIINISKDAEIPLFVEKVDNRTKKMSSKTFLNRPVETQFELPSGRFDLTPSKMTLTNKAIEKEICFQKTEANIRKDGDFSVARKNFDSFESIACSITSLHKEKEVTGENLKLVANQDAVSAMVPSVSHTENIPLTQISCLKNNEASSSSVSQVDQQSIIIEGKNKRKINTVAPGKKVELIADKLQHYLSLLCSGSENGSESCGDNNINTFPMEKSKRKRATKSSAENSNTPIYHSEESSDTFPMEKRKRKRATKSSAENSNTPIYHSEESSDSTFVCSSGNKKKLFSETGHRSGEENNMDSSTAVSQLMVDAHQLKVSDHVVQHPKDLSGEKSGSLEMKRRKTTGNSITYTKRAMKHSMSNVTKSLAKSSKENTETIYVTKKETRDMFQPNRQTITVNSDFVLSHPISQQRNECTDDSPKSKKQKMADFSTTDKSISKQHSKQLVDTPATPDPVDICRKSTPEKDTECTSPSEAPKQMQCQPLHFKVSHQIPQHPNNGTDGDLPKSKKQKMADFSTTDKSISKQHSKQLVGTPALPDPVDICRKSTPTKISQRTPEKDTVPTLPSETPKQIQCQPQHFKVSQHISQHPNKFAVSNIVNGFEVLMAAQKTPPKKSPSKRLGKNSPIKLARNNRSPNKLKYRIKSPNKKLFDDDSGLIPSAETQSQSSVHYASFSEEHVVYFKTILDEVLKDKEMSGILSNEELNVLTRFKTLENQHMMKLYVRMLGRKYTWHRVSDIKYPDITDVCETFNELELSGLVTSDYKSEELHILFNLLKLQELKSLCKIFRIQPFTKPKPQLIEALLGYARNQQTVSQSDSTAVLRSRLRDILGYCIKLCPEPRQAFHRALLLFSLPHNDDSDRESSKQLLLLHYVKTNRVEYPTYKVHKTRQIFSSRDDLLRFEEAAELMINLNDAMVSKNWHDAQQYGRQAQKNFRRILNDCAITTQVETLPLFIRRYTAGSTYAYAMTSAIDAFRKDKNLYLECVGILQELLSQGIYLPHYRGKWYEDLALILQTHLKNFKQAAETIITAMKDENLNEVQQQTISYRGSLLLSRKTGVNNSLKLKLVDIIKQPLREPPSITIKAKSLQSNAPGRKQVYIREDKCKQETTYSSVEEYVVAHYKTEGYVGVHAEGSIITTLFGLMFWDIIYEYPVPDVFRTPYQSDPLDLNSSEFYTNRKQVIDKKLQDMSKWDKEYTSKHLERMFRTHEGKVSVVNWQRFPDLQQIIQLVSCIGMEVLSKILERVVKNYRAVRSGFPDLVLWNAQKSECKFVEVKGPSDRLSIGQKMWLNYLRMCNANAEVCYVEATGGKKLRKKKTVQPSDEEDG